MKGNEAEILLRDMQEYRELTDRVKAIYGDQMTLKDMVDVMERIIREPGRKDPVNARILTYDEAAMWDEYRKIGMPEECRTAVAKQIAQTPDFEGDGYSDGHIVYDTWICPGCGEHYEVEYDKYEYCPHCGQKISWDDWNDWENEDDEE